MKLEGWVNIYKYDDGYGCGTGIYGSEADARSIGEGDSYYMTSCRIEFEDHER